MILDEIMAYKRQALDRRRRAVPLRELERRSSDRSAPLDLAAALRGDRVCLIAEIKRASPSKGVLRPAWDPVELATTYARNGAAAISVLTESKFFQGDLEFLPRIRSTLGRDGRPARTEPGELTAIPLLRKDFIFDPYQVVESYALGADALLLIAAVLADEMLRKLLTLTHDLGMTALVEIHDEEELGRVLRLHPRVVGINNRNLHDFSVDLGTFGRLRPSIPDDVVTVAESGVRTAADVRRLAEMGADAVLVGEALVTATDVAGKVRELTGIGAVRRVAITDPGGAL